MESSAASGENVRLVARGHSDSCFAELQRSWRRPLHCPQSHTAGRKNIFVGGHKRKFEFYIFLRRSYPGAPVASEPGLVHQLGESNAAISAAGKKFSTVCVRFLSQNWGACIKGSCVL